jgi:hypothetical protein
MRRLANGLFVLLAGSAIGAEDAPPATVAVAPEPSPVPLAVPYQVFLRPEQAQYGAILPPGPAQSLAIAEAGGAVFAGDPGVAGVAALLSQLTASYVEDAPRIAAITLRIVREIRAVDQDCSPVEVLAGAVGWRRPPQRRGDLPRQFERFAAEYRRLRIDGKKDHAAALSLMQK